MRYSKQEPNYRRVGKDNDAIWRRLGIMGQFGGRAAVHADLELV